MNFFMQMWRSNTLRKKILLTIGILVIYRILAQIAVPGVDTEAVRQFFAGESSGPFGIYSMLTGGAMEKFSILMMGLAPYINASIIMQLMSVVVPKFERMQKEGEVGQKKLNLYTRWLTVFFAFGQSYGVLYYIGSNITGIDLTNVAQVLPLMLTITAGTLLLLWLGEQITEKGIGNGVSLIIFASIVSSIPSIISGVVGSVESLTGNSGKLIPFLFFIVVVIALIVATILATEGQRKIPVHYGMGGKSMASSLPIRVLQAGMIPIIFALSLLTFPAIVVQMMGATGLVADFITQHLSSSANSPVFYLAYIFLIIFFSYFYVSIVFKTDDIAENIQKRGGFIPGYRPGRETSEHLSEVSFRLNLWGGLFLAAVAVIPMLFTLFSSSLTQQDLIISGSGIIIVVGVVLDMIRKINEHLSMQDYEKLH